MSTKTVENSERLSENNKNERNSFRSLTTQERLDTIRQTKLGHTALKQQAGPRDNDDWGQIPLTTQEFHFKPQTQHPQGFVLGPSVMSHLKCRR